MFLPRLLLRYVTLRYVTLRYGDGYRNYGYGPPTPKLSPQKTTPRLAIFFRYRTSPLLGFWSQNWQPQTSQPHIPRAPASIKDTERADHTAVCSRPGARQHIAQRIRIKVWGCAPLVVVAPTTAWHAACGVLM